MKAGVSFSNQADSFAAGRTAAARAVNVSGPPVLTLVFTTDGYEPAQVLAGVKSVVSPALVAGFCCGGVLTTHGVQKQGVGVLALSGDFQAATTLQEGLDRDPFTAGQKAGLALQQAGLKNGTAIVLPDGFQANMLEMLRGLYGQLGPDFQYIGGGAGDNLKFFKTCQFTDQGVAQNALAVALVQGLNIGRGTEHGFIPVGAPLVISKSEGKRVYEINGTCAFLEYSRRVGLMDRQQFAALAMRHPLGFPNIFGRHIIRDPLRVNEDNSLDFVSEIPSQAVGQIMEYSIKGLVEAARKAAEQALLSVTKPAFILLFDCISRFVLLGDHFLEEIHALQEVIGPDVPMLGALAFGEIGSFDNVPLFHNKTIVVAVGSEM